MAAETRTWQELCEAASQESDSTQLMALIAELMKALDERDQSARTNTCGNVCQPTQAFSETLDIRHERIEIKSKDLDLQAKEEETQETRAA